MKLVTKTHFHAAHRLHHLEEGHPCRNLHGHTYHLEVEVEGKVGPDGMVLDFKQLKTEVQRIVEDLDHAVLMSEDDKELLEAVNLLASKFYIVKGPTTCEVLANLIRNRLAYTLPRQVLALKVSLWETPTNGVVTEEVFKC